MKKVTVVTVLILSERRRHQRRRRHPVCRCFRRRLPSEYLLRTIYLRTGLNK
ncbi:Hypothetical protein CINCED_3A019922 [Cinara cedri]|uniref:Uncharacterized protein n=1 Tax=Cinara cedri TaxID=506608 RepID=A0A5E4NNW4_9HEMI|nr:Hypothetical protein CINCED_3A019922 [Cinara cedri]